MRKFLFIIAVLGSLVANAQEVICHRGYWDAEGSAQNSIRSLVKADSIGAWGSEFDVWMTADGVLVVNHDEAYGDEVGAGGSSLVAAGIAASFPIVTAQADGDGARTDDPNDSATTPGYLEFGEEYGELSYGDEIIHVADLIAGSGTSASSGDLDLMFGQYRDDMKASKQETKYRYFSNNDGTHRKYSADPSLFTEENCKYNAKGVCTLCGYVKPSEEKTPTQDTKRKLKTQTLKVSKAAKRVRASRLKKKARFTSKVKVTGAKTKVTFKKLKRGSSSRLTLTKAGKIKVRRGTPKGTYRIRIKVTAARTSKYKAASKVATIKVVVI